MKPNFHHCFSSTPHLFIKCVYTAPMELTNKPVNKTCHTKTMGVGASGITSNIHPPLCPTVLRHYTIPTHQEEGGWGGL